MTKNPLLAEGAKGTSFALPSLIIHRERPTYEHDLARAYNRRMAQERPEAADRIEWYVNSVGSLALRDIPEVSVSRAKRITSQRETERQHWIREEQTRDRPFAPHEPEERLAL